MLTTKVLAAALLAAHTAHAVLPSKIYGVNLGSWLVLEPWMLPAGGYGPVRALCLLMTCAEWLAMGGEQCGDCSQCIASEL